MWLLAMRQIAVLWRYLKTFLAAACVEDKAEETGAGGSIGLGLERTKLANSLALLRTKRRMKIEEVEVDAKLLLEDLLKEYESREGCRELYDSIVAARAGAVDDLQDPNGGGVLEARRFDDQCKVVGLLQSARGHTSCK